MSRHTKRPQSPLVHVSPVKPKQERDDQLNTILGTKTVAYFGSYMYARSFLGTSDSI